MLNPTCCIRLATSSNTVQHRPTMLDSTMLDDVASVWPGLNTTRLVCPKTRFMCIFNSLNNEGHTML